MKKLPFFVNGEYNPFFSLWFSVPDTSIFESEKLINLSPTARFLANLKLIFPSLSANPMLWKSED